MAARPIMISAWLTNILLTTHMMELLLGWQVSYMTLLKVKCFFCQSEIQDDCYYSRKLSLGKFHGRHNDLVDRYGISVSQMTRYVPLVVHTSWSFPHS